MDNKSIDHSQLISVTSEKEPIVYMEHYNKLIESWKKQNSESFNLTEDANRLRK